MHDTAGDGVETIRDGCDLLAARLAELLTRARAVRRSVDSAGPAADAQPPGVREPLADLVGVVADAVDDVSDRLRLLDDVLYAMRDEAGPH